MKSIIIFALVVIGGSMAVCFGQQKSLSTDLKAVVLRDAACANAAGTPEKDQKLETLPIRAGGRDVGTIVEVQGACHCQNTNCEALVYLRDGNSYRLALHEKYASLHPMKIVKSGMPSLTGQFAISALQMETTVYDWDGKAYKPSLCATVIKGKKVPTITQHPCKTPSQ